MTATNSASTPAAEQHVSVGTLFADLDEEFAATRRMLERFPDEHTDWRPHERSMTLLQLAAHVANLPHFGHLITQGTEFNFATTPYVAPTAATRAELLELFDRRSAAARTAIGGLDAATMGETWRLCNGDITIVSAPRAACLRKLMLSHITHHRGQLTVYYRLLDVPVPGLYGPSADEH